MSPRAAWRLEALGFARVYDYVAGKADWLAAGLPAEGPLADTPRPGSLARRDAPTCRSGDPVALARSRVREGTWGRCVVLNEEEVVMGVLTEKILAAAPEDSPAEAVMQLGPTTVRANEDLAGLAHRMHDRDAASVLVTTPEGRLIGVLVRADAEAALPGG